MDKLLFSDIRTVATKLLHDAVLTPTELVNGSLSRLKKTSAYNAFITVSTHTAKDLARESDSRYKTKSTVSKLDGIPIAIKDNFCTDGIRTTCASVMLQNFIPTYNATVYERLKKAGAILVGKCNLDQFAMGSGTVDGIFGPTKNNWGYKKDCPDFFIAGGSSGGSAVAVATGTVYAAIGSDTGGSTRNPASYCGVVGLKPTYGLVSRVGLIPLVNSMDVPGILTRTVDDCSIVLNAIAGHDPKDSTTYNKKFKEIVLPDVDNINLKNLKVGIPKEYHCDNLSAEVLQTWKDVAQLLTDNGACVREVSLPHTECSIVCYSILNQVEVASNMARYDGIEFGHRASDNSSTEKLYATSRSEGFNEVVRNRILTGNYFLLSKNYDKYVRKAMQVRRLILNDFDNVWEDVQILLTPTTLSTAPLHSDFVSKTNRDQCATQDFCTQPANMAGVPAISIPIKLSSTGMPLSLQLIGKNLSEQFLLTIAKYIENIVQFNRTTT